MKYATLFLILLIGTSQIAAQEKLDFDLKLPKLYNDNGDGFVVIAHRGASAYTPENTLVAFRKAVELKAEMIELDVLMSKDGIPVVFHDGTLDKTSNGTGNVSDYTLEELKKLDAGSWFSDEYKETRIPTLEEVLEFAKGKIALNIEIKTEAVTDNLRGGVEEKAIELVRKYEMDDYIIFSSFDYRAVKHLKELAPDLSTALLYENKQSGDRGPFHLITTLRADAFNCSYRQLTEDWMNQLKSNEIPVFVYTVNDEEIMTNLIKRGVTGIFSDKPDVLKKVATNLLGDT